MQRKPVRVSTAVAVSLVAHALLLSMAVGGAGFGLPSLTLPWAERRVGADDLRITLARTQPLMPAPEMAPVITSEPLPVQAAPPPVPEMTMPAPPALPTPATAAATVSAAQLAPVQKTVDRDTELAALSQRQEAAHAEQTTKDDQARIQLERAESVRREAARLEAAHRASLREEALANERASQEAEREATARMEQARQAQQDAARRDTANLEAAREEKIRQEQAKLELVKQEQVQQEQVRREQVRQEQLKQTQQAQARQEQARQDQVREQAAQELARTEPLRQEQARLAQIQRDRAEQEAQREERLRAIGQQMKQEAKLEADQRTPLAGASSARRGWLFGRADANAELVKYAEEMARKIELNQTMDIVRDALKQAHVAPIVTVAIRADGSVEKVTFVVSSGALALDDAIRKVIASQARYAAFTPALARQYDVVEIRRTWNFDTAIRLQ
ncbi:MAG: hypothetical protein M3Y65_19630 [Pseudomonadota bacterium]|nr:hypothetical protein [Pseudomonadota bacterium]